MGKPGKDFKDRLFDILIKIDAMKDLANRDFLLRGLPAGPVGAISRSPGAKLPDLNAIVEAAAWMGQLLDTGEWALDVVARNASILVEGTPYQLKFKELQASREVQTDATIEPIPEAIVFGQDARLPVSFLERGVAASRAVAKLVVTRVFGGVPRQGSGSLVTGTGWMIAPGLLITNRHVVEARFRNEDEAPATDSDIRAQATTASAWFDFVDVEGPYWQYPVQELVAIDAKLDYALLRLAPGPMHALPVGGEMRDLASWGYLGLVPTRPSLSKGSRLNIVQHSMGGPKQIAIRDNYYYDSLSTAEQPERIRYLTDTEPGASGSPVFNDNWRVVALHHASVRVPESKYKGEVLKFNNQGITMMAIIEHLPEAVRSEIEAAQGWA